MDINDNQNNFLSPFPSFVPTLAYLSDSDEMPSAAFSLPAVVPSTSTLSLYNLQQTNPVYKAFADDILKKLLHDILQITQSLSGASEPAYNSPAIEQQLSNVESFLNN